MNDHWKVLYKFYVFLDGPLQTLRFCSDMKFKMAATAGLSLTPMGKMILL